MWKFIKKFFKKTEPKPAGPWAMLEVAEFEESGRIKLRFDFNDEFVKKIHSMGFHAETDEDSVMLFFTTGVLSPQGLVGEEKPTQPEAHPNLSSPNHVLKV